MKRRQALPSFWFYNLVVVLAAGACLLTGCPRTKPGKASSTSLPSEKTSPSKTETGGAVDAAAFDARWQAWRQQLSASGHENELAAEFEALVAADPARALRLARAETDPARRLQLLRIIFLLWGEADPTTAAAATMALAYDERREGAAAMFAGAAKNPAVAVDLARELCRKDHELALDHGYSLINVLSQFGQYRAAVGFVLDFSAGAEGEEANKWLKAAFAKWAERDTDAALAAVNELALPALRFEALDAVASGRVGSDPAGLAEMLRKLPSGEDRNLILGIALRAWVQNDLKTASLWLNEQPPAAELDAGAAAVAHATGGKMFNQQPEVALSWAESIVDPELRSRTLAAVVVRWFESDPGQARRYLENSAGLLPADRAELLARLSRP